ncbi:hypothetical protein ETB97_010388 [Aspergillus alliaceus]|uniref:Uncharacterized protein n=1 Tax=Petromyces alliaceus TaxID=209559 RepID=A0A8H6E8F5_PETAA|nr:hypothetical protein ETB97_010388 [Aspergillus burnettii]
MPTDTSIILPAALLATCNPGPHNSTEIRFEHGYALPGVTAYTDVLGLFEIDMKGETVDAVVREDLDPCNPANVIYASSGAHLDGRAFGRAQTDGITRAHHYATNENGQLRGMGVGIKAVLQFTIADSDEGAEDAAPSIKILLFKAAWDVQYAGLSDERPVALVFTGI